MAPSLQRKFSCPVEVTLEMVSGKWKPVILAHLKQGALRYTELRSLMPAISEKVLTQRLKDLEELELVQRKQPGGRGRPSHYQLTARGRSLRAVLQAMYDWGELIAPQVGALIEIPARPRARMAPRT
jgi:DNA-binding HxlR family transcriptional regulator